MPDQDERWEHLATSICLSKYTAPPDVIPATAVAPHHCPLSLPIAAKNNSLSVKGEVALLGEQLSSSFRSGLTAFVLLLGAAAAAHAQPSDIVWSGTGFFINRDGWIVTNAHVVEGCRRVSVPSLGETKEWVLDSINDLAAIKISSGQGKESLLLRDAPARLGEDIVAVGYPLATLLSSSVKITAGNINSLLGIGDDTRYLQISAPIQPGNSGGPLVDRTGLVLAVNTATLKSSAIGEASVVPQNVNFAIRSSVLELFLQSRDIKFEKSAPTDMSAMSTADLAERVSPSVVQVICHRPTEAPPAAVVSTSPVPEPASGQTDAEKARDFAIRYHVAWSQPNNAALASMRDLYANRVTFYGKSIDRGAVMSEKQRFAARWPIRSYEIRPGSLSSSCNADVCTVSAVVDWFAKSPERGKAASGVASFELGVDLRRGVILSETGSVLKGQKPDIQRVIGHWQDLNSKCRGGSGNEQATLDACADREKVGETLTAADWCYGREGEYGYQMEWHRCGPTSLK